MSEQTPGVTSDDKLWAALAYVFSPILPIILMLMEDKKDRPFLRAHYIQALIMGLILWFIIPILAFPTIGCSSLLWFIMFYWAYKAYQGELINIPIITDFVKNQGWA